MVKSLTDSSIDRQNILNNKYALQEIQKAAGIDGVVFENELRFLKSQLASFFEIDERTIDRYLERHRPELKKNGYETFKGKRLIDFKLALMDDFGNDINVVTKTTRLGVFNFKSFLNLSMLLVESEKARFTMQ